MKTDIARIPLRICNHSVGLFYQHWPLRYLLYLVACVLFGLWTFIAFEIYGWKTWRITSISFRGIHAWHTLMNFGFCLYLADEWLARLAGSWGRFENRTLGKQAMIWGASFIVGFYVQRTLVFEGIQYYALDLYHYYEQFPQMRPRPWGHFLFCTPFWLTTIFLLGVMASLRQRRLINDQNDLDALKQELAAKRAQPSAERSSDSSKVRIETANEQIILDPQAISHITVEDHYCRIHTVTDSKPNSYFVKSSLADLLDKLPEDRFIQIHRSHVVNLESILRVEKKNRAYRLHLQSEAILPISRYRIQEVKEQLARA